ncbi:MAG TPA: tRNA preQ1(34) S-adenosylmethionine ribosyltransferase-isomerase QueA [Steroidobacteraceae bacterium]|nr:tRNA preQ1(34) S-adenosylmethionine ribosyltransferase-isomerase QueA [Steroidobacteraceae bacterium]
MRPSEFRYELPPELIAQEPLAERSASRLLVLDPAPADGDGPAARAARERAACVRDASMRDLPQLLSPGDLLVFNDTKVVAARLIGIKPTGGRVEILLERPLEADAALVQARASKGLRAGTVIHTAGGDVRVLGPDQDLWRVALPCAALEFFERWGEVPLPPYIRRPPRAADRERYQSVFARCAGAVAAPTASLHFDAPLLEALERRGIERAFVTLHVGAGTFQPIRTDDVHAHAMHAERTLVSSETAQALARARARGGRVIAVGTTVVRALESAARESPAAELRAWSGETRLFIGPGFRFRVVDGLLTNFHLPESTLLMLVCALAGRERVLAAYAHAVRLRYRFFSYGDAMLVVPAHRPERHAAAL